MNILPSNKSNIEKTPEFKDAIKRCPKVSFPHEITFSKNFNTPIEYDIVCVIPVGKKVMIWMTYIDDIDVAILFNLNNDKKIINSQIIATNIPCEFAYGTLLYGTILNNDENNDADNKIVIIHDIFYFKGLYLQSFLLKDKMIYLLQFFKEINFNNFILQNKKLHFAINQFWNFKSIIEKSSSQSQSNSQSPSENDITYFSIYNYFHLHIENNLNYEVHHLQIRKLYEISPHYNLPIDTIEFKLQNCCKKNIHEIEMNNYLLQNCFNNGLLNLKPFIIKNKNKFDEKTNLNFIVKPTEQQDLYLLYIYGKDRKMIYFDILGIQNSKQSYLIGKHFYEYYNSHLEKIIGDNSYIYSQSVLTQEIIVQCCFDKNIKKWIPLYVYDENIKPKIAHCSMFY